MLNRKTEHRKGLAKILEFSGRKIYGNFARVISSHSGGSLGFLKRDRENFPNLSDLIDSDLDNRCLKDPN